MRALHSGGEGGLRDAAPGRDAKGNEGPQGCDCRDGGQGMIVGWEWYVVRPGVVTEDGGTMCVDDMYCIYDALETIMR